MCRFVCAACLFLPVSLKCCGEVTFGNPSAFYALALSPVVIPIMHCNIKTRGIVVLAQKLSQYSEHKYKNVTTQGELRKQCLVLLSSWATGVRVILGLFCFVLGSFFIH